VPSKQTEQNPSTALTGGLLFGVIGLTLCATFLVIGPNGKLHTLRKAQRNESPHASAQRGSDLSTTRSLSLFTPSHSTHSNNPNLPSFHHQPKRKALATTAPHTQSKSHSQSQQTALTGLEPQETSSSNLKTRLIHEARRFAKQSKEPWRNLISIALEEQRNGNRASALKLIESADRLASDPDNAQEEAFAKREIVKAMLSMQLDEEAISIASSLIPGKHRDGALSDLSTWLAKDGQIQLSKSVVQSIKNKKSRNRALTYVSENEVNTLGMNFAIATASEIPDERYRDEALKKAALRAASLNDYINAELAANTIGNHRRKDSTFSAIASVRIKSDAIEPSIELLRRIVDSRIADETMRQLAVYLAKERRFSASGLVIQHINNQKEVDFARQQLSANQAKAGRLPEAIAELNRIQNTNYRERTLSLIASSVAKTQGVYRARNIADQIQTDKLRDQTYRNMADYAAITDDLTTAFNLTQDIHASYEKTTALAYISRRRLQAGDTVMANRYLSDAEYEFLNIDSSSSRDRALTTLSTIYAEMGEPEISLEKAYTIKSIRQRDRTYKTLAKILASKKQIHIATSTAKAIVNDEERLKAMDSVALTYGKVVSPDSAIKMARKLQSNRQKTLFLLEVSRRT